MNQELTQRIIGAVVVTALAGIFVPMLFDDPINDSSQAVTELNIPKEPTVIIEGTADKLPTDAHQVFNATESELSANEPDMSLEPLENSAPMGGDAEPDEPSEQNIVSEEEELVADEEEPSNDDLAPRKEAPHSLDTGVIKETRTENPVKKPKKAVITPEVQVAKTPAKPVSKPVKSTAEPKPSPDLTRWTIQAGTFSKKENAQAMLDKLHKQGLAATLETIKTGKGVLYRLKVGPELDKKRAIAIKSKLDKQNIKNYLMAE
jgi:DedD protein